MMVFTDSNRAFTKFTVVYTAFGFYCVVHQVVWVACKRISWWMATQTA